MSILQDQVWGDIGFTGTSCVDFGRALTVKRWDLLGSTDGWASIRCSVDLLPQTGSVVYEWVNNGTGEVQPGQVATVLQMDSYRTYRPQAAWESLLSVTPEDALVYSSAIVFVWVIAWGIKAAIRALNIGDSNEQTEERG